MSAINISVADLQTEEGVTQAGAQMARVTCEGVLWPTLDHTPPEMRQVLMERFLSGLAGAMCAEIGPGNAKAVLDEVKIAIDGLVSERRRAH